MQSFKIGFNRTFEISFQQLWPSGSSNEDQLDSKSVRKLKGLEETNSNRKGIKTKGGSKNQNPGKKPGSEEINSNQKIIQISLRDDFNKFIASRKYNDVISPFNMK